eukprot:10342196-Alexandrium_andersonii.AAC.1
MHVARFQRGAANRGLSWVLRQGTGPAALQGDQLATAAVIRLLRRGPARGGAAGSTHRGGCPG